MFLSLLKATASALALLVQLGVGGPDATDAPVAKKPGSAQHGPEAEPGGFDEPQSSEELTHGPQAEPIG